MTRRHQLRRTQKIAAPLEVVTDFFENPRNLETLTPAFLKFRIETNDEIEMREGATIDYRISLYGLPMRWRTEIVQYNPGVDFVDFQSKGPFKYWHHLHSFRATSKGRGTEMTDLISYELPFGVLGTLAHHIFVQSRLKTIFDYRALVVDELFGTA